MFWQMVHQQNIYRKLIKIILITIIIRFQKTLNIFRKRKIMVLNKFCLVFIFGNTVWGRLLDRVWNGVPYFTTSNLEWNINFSRPNIDFGYDNIDRYNRVNISIIIYLIYKTLRSSTSNAFIHQKLLIVVSLTVIGLK